VPGVHVVDEDALGVNLNIGARGLDPRRSSRTLLLEDGMPIHLAPYSDPSAHYHPPSERVERLEVLKGSGQVVHGPLPTLPTPSSRPTGLMAAAPSA
jgi:Fe(3+) dicitrate transport protein